MKEIPTFTFYLKYFYPPTTIATLQGTTNIVMLHFLGSTVYGRAQLSETEACLDSENICERS
jgi:hypothetical protein